MQGARGAIYGPTYPGMPQVSPITPPSVGASPLGGVLGSSGMAGAQGGQVSLCY